MTQPGLDSGLINLESSTLTIRPEVLWLKEEHSSTLESSDIRPILLFKAGC